MTKVMSLFKRKKASQASFEALLAPHLKALYRQAFRYCGSADEAEDLLQELLLETVQKQTQLHAAAEPAAWLSRCLYHRFVDSYRQQQRQVQTDSMDTAPLVLDQHSGNVPETEYQYQQLLGLLELLSPEQRMVVTMHDIEGYTLPELAKTMEMPLGTLKSHLHRGRKKLKQNISVQPFE